MPRMKHLLLLVVVGLCASITVGDCCAQNGGASDEMTRDQAVQIFKGEVVVPARQAYGAPFSVPPGARNCVVVVKLSARGGTGNDIRIVLAATFAGGASYDYGQRSNLNEVATLPDGNPRFVMDYALRLDNRFSVVSQKRVTGSAVLMYDLPPRQ